MEKCIVCGEPARIYNSQQLPVCRPHEKHEAMELRCPQCKGFLDVKKGKWGSFFTCMSCGVLSIKKLKSMTDLFFMKRG